MPLHNTRPPPPPRLYFAYGANLAFQQMAARCPGSFYVGRAVLPDYRWQINERGYANILPSPGSSVHGLLYELGNNPSFSKSLWDETLLDRSEGVNSGFYLKKTCTVVVYPARQGVMTWRAAAALVGGVSGRDEGAPRVEDNVLVYLSDAFVRPGEPRAEYVDRMNDGIRNAVAMGVPAAYFANVVRAWVPERGQVASDDGVGRVPTAREELAELIRQREELTSRREELARRVDELMGRQPSRSRSLSGSGRRQRPASPVETITWPEWGSRTSEDLAERALSLRAVEEQSRTSPPTPPDAATPRDESPSQGDEQPDNESVDSFSVADLEISFPVVIRPQFTAAIHTLLDRSELPLQTALRVPLLGGGNFDDDNLGTVEVTMLPLDCIAAIRRRFYSEEVMVRLGPSTRFALLPEGERPVPEGQMA